MYVGNGRVIVGGEGVGGGFPEIEQKEIKCKKFWKNLLVPRSTGRRMSAKAKLLMGIEVQSEVIKSRERVKVIDRGESKRKSGVRLVLLKSWDVDEVKSRWSRL